MEPSLPSRLSRLLQEIIQGISSDASIGIEELEWLFFGGIFHQFAIFGGRVPLLDISEKGLADFEVSEEFDLLDIEEISWPPLPTLSLEEMRPLIDIFSKYSDSPRLWSAALLYEPGEYLSLEVESLLQISELQNAKVREQISLLVSSQDWGQSQLIASETVRMLGDKPIFRFPGDPH